MKALTLLEKNEKLELNFNFLEDWDSFEVIASILEQEFQVLFIEKINGPESKLWTLKINNAELLLINNPYGNLLRATSTEGKKELIHILNTWNCKWGMKNQDQHESFPE